MDERVESSKDIKKRIKKAIQNQHLQLSLRKASEAFNENRAKVFQDLEEYEDLREAARNIKERAVGNLEMYLERLTENLEANGGTMIVVKDAKEARKYVANLAKSRKVKIITKSKSMTSEEIRLNDVLERTGMKVVETDLGQRILQLAGENSSHIVVPAIHKTAEEVADLFAEKLGSKLRSNEPEALTKVARKDLREWFLEADMGITGVNFGIAETGTIVLFESEGNIRLTTQIPPIHVALMGIEKVIPSVEDLLIFFKLLPGSAIGKRLTSYVSFFSGPTSTELFDFERSIEASEREFHLVVIDNGRSRMKADRDLQEALYCIRCGACMNACAVYQKVGGHVFGGLPYVGGIGIPWTMITEGMETASSFNELCTTCGRCTEVCPVKIDIPWLATIIKHKMHKIKGPSITHRFFANVEKIGKLASIASPVSNWFNNNELFRFSLEKTLGIDRGRKLPVFHGETFVKWFHEHDRIKVKSSLKINRKVAFFCDCFTNYNRPEVGKSAVTVLEKIGIPVHLAGNKCCGRAMLSQGMIDEAREHAEYNADLLNGLIDEGYDVIGVETSCIAALKKDYRHLVGEEEAQRLRKYTYDAMEYLEQLRQNGELNLKFKDKPKKTICHGQCQQKAAGFNEPTINLLKSIPGLEMEVVEVECCGMAGSFGYKKDFFELSSAIGEKLAQKLEGLEGQIVTSGISCHSQIEMATNRSVKHPIQIVEEAL